MLNVLKQITPTIIVSQQDMMAPFNNRTAKFAHLVVICVLDSLLFASGCVDNNKTSVHITACIDLSQKKEVSLADFVERVDLIPLDSRTDALVSSLTASFVVYDEGYMFVDRRDGIIKVFNRDGVYVETIDKTGRGPGEFIGGNSLFIDAADSTLQVLTPSRGIYTYSLHEKHSYLGNIEVMDKVPAVHHFFPLGDGRYLLFSASAGSRVYLYQDPGELIHEYFQEIPRWFSLSPYYDFAQQPPFYKLGGEVFFYTGFDGSIYRFDTESETFDPYFTWDFGSHTLPVDRMDESEVSIKNQAWKQRYDELSKQYVLRVTRVCETSRFIVAGAYYEGQSITLLYDKEKREASYFDTTKEGLRFYASFAWDDACYVLLSPENMSMYVSRDIIGDSSSSLLDSIKQDSNSILLRYVLKK